MKTLSNDLTIPSFLARGKPKKRAIQIPRDAQPWDAPSKFITRLPEFFTKPVEIRGEETISKKVIPTIQDRIAAKASGIIMELEGMVDDGMITVDFSMYDYLRSKYVSTVVANKVAEHFAPITDELLQVMTVTEDKDLQYAYRGYNTKDITNLAMIYQGMLDDCAR